VWSIGTFLELSERQGREFIPAWGEAPGKRRNKAEGLKARSIIDAMPQSLSFVLVHIIFTTKDRKPVLDDLVRPALYAYLATVARNLKCECYRVGGVADHVHLAVRLSRMMNAAELVETLKSSSSKWLKTQSPKLTKFAWQRGYGAFSVGPADLEMLIQYIDNQETHHRKITFQDELRAFLAKYGVDFDERYLWD
jgi:putative transposase